MTLLQPLFNKGFLDTGGSLFTTVYRRNFGISSNEHRNWLEEMVVKATDMFY